MKKTLKYLGLLVLLPLFTVALTTNLVNDADAIKAQGKLTNQYGKATASIVCGDRLCSEIPGGRAAFEAGEVPVEEEEAEVEMEKEIELEEEITIEEEIPIEEEMMEETMEEVAPGSVLRLSRANVPAIIPLHQGYYDGGSVYFIVTDASDQKHADIVTEQQGWKVELAPLLANAPEAALSPVYIFKNGVEGSGVHGFQSEVFSSTPAQEDYSALTSHVHVMWNDDATPEVLDSKDAILDAQANDMVTFTEPEVVMNMPQIDARKSNSGVVAPKSGV